MSKSRVPQQAWQRLMQAAPEEGVQPLTQAKRIDIDLIHADPRQPRKHFDPAAMDELIASVRERGILQPITVQRRPEGGYFVVTGERRLRAARAAELDTVPAIVVDLTETELRLDRVIENRQRKDLTDVEFARAIVEIRQDLGARAPNLTSNELDEHVGERLGLSGRTIRSFAALLNLDPEIEAMLGDELTELRTRGLARVGYDPALQRALAEAILEHNLSGRQTLAVAQQLKRHPGLLLDEALDQVLGRAPADEPEPEVAVVTAAPEPTPSGDGLDPNDPGRRYALVMTYLARAGAILAEPGADEEVPLNRQQVVDLARLLDPLVELRTALEAALRYIAQREAQGDPGYEGEPLPRQTAPMLPFGRQPEAAPATSQPQGAHARPRLRAVPKPSVEVRGETEVGPHK